MKKKMTNKNIQSISRIAIMRLSCLPLIFLVAMAAASCGNAPKASNSAADEELSESMTDWNKEQKRLDTDTRLQLDSLVAEVRGIANDLDSKATKDAYARCLLLPKQADEALTMSSQYAVLAMLMVDRQTAAANDINAEAYDVACSRLIASINDPALLQLDTLVCITMSQVNDDKDLKQAAEWMQKYHDKEVDAGRAPYFWTTTVAGMVERLYLAINIGNMNLDKVTDAQAANISRHTSIIVNNIKRIAEHDETMEKLASVIEPFHELNACNSKDFKTQMKSISSKIGMMRRKLLEK